MYVTDHQKLARAREAAAILDSLTRAPKRVYPSAPAIIPVTMILVALFVIVALVIKFLMRYMHSKEEKQSKNFRLSPSSPDIPTAPEDQTSMATTASMKTGNSVRINPTRGSKRAKKPAVSLYQVTKKQQHSPATPSSRNRAAMRVIAKAASGRRVSRDSLSRRDEHEESKVSELNDSPVNSSQRSDITEELPPPMDQIDTSYVLEHDVSVIPEGDISQVKEKRAQEQQPVALAQEPATFVSGEFFENQQPSEGDNKPSQQVGTDI